jgi:hypothetical protein
LLLLDFIAMVDFKKLSKRASAQNLYNSNIKNPQSIQAIKDAKTKAGNRLYESTDPATTEAWTEVFNSANSQLEANNKRQSKVRPRSESPPDSFTPSAKK